MRRIIASIDIGTSSIKIVVGEMIKNKLNILAVSDTPSFGVKKGVIVDAEQAISSLRVGLKKIEDVLGLKVKKAIVSVPSYSAEFVLGEGITTITNPDRLIGGSDIIMAMQASVYNKVPVNMELVTVTPTVYSVNDTIVKNPKGMVSEKLHVKTVISMVPKKNVYSIVGICEKCGVKVIDISLGSIGDYYTNKTPKTEDSIGAIINLGDETTTVSIFNKGVLTNTEVIDLGGQTLENDLIFIYKIKRSNAEDIKSQFALCHKRMANAGEVEIVTNKLGNEIKINQYEASEIMMSRLKEILNLAKKQINLLTKKEISYIILTGGLSEAKDFNLILEEIFGHSASIGRINEIGVRDNKFSTSVGLIKYFSDRLILKDKSFSIFSIEEIEELIDTNKRINVSQDSILGKLFGYFFDN